MKIVEVYKTNVEDQQQGNRIIYFLHRNYPWYNANFDLHDTDRILRIESYRQTINNENIINLVKQFGCTAEVLPD
ncbi:MAG: hypothetical protein ACTHMM_07490 [Agriterribacter sp.]